MQVWFTFSSVLKSHRPWSLSNWEYRSIPLILIVIQFCEVNIFFSSEGNILYHTSFNKNHGHGIVSICVSILQLIPYFHRKFVSHIVLESTTILPTTGSLLLSNVSQRDAGVYTCSATNYITGQIIDSSLKVTVTVEPPGEPASPRFLYIPQAKYIVQTGKFYCCYCYYQIR